MDVGCDQRAIGSVTQANAQAVFALPVLIKLRVMVLGRAPDGAA